MAQTTFFGNRVEIPNCPICSKSIGKHNCGDEGRVYGRGAFIIKTKCIHYYHGNCCQNNSGHMPMCAACNEPFEEVERINLHHTDWWVVEAFWKNNFGT